MRPDQGTDQRVDFPVSTGGAGEAARRSVVRGTIFAALGASAYGINIVAARLTAQHGITGPDMVVYRALIFIPLVFVLLLATGRRATLTTAERPAVYRFALFAATTAIAYISSLRFLPVPQAVTIFYTYPLLVILLSPYVTGVRLSLRRWFVALLAFAGVLLAVGPHLDVVDPRGIALAFIGAMACAGMFITGTNVTTDGLQTFFWSQLFSLPMALALAYVTGGLATPDVMLGAALPFAITATGFFIGLLLQILASARLSAASAGMLFLIEPVVAIGAAALILREHVTFSQGIGMLLVIGALIFDVLPGLRRPRLPGLSAQ